MDRQGFAAGSRAEAGDALERAALLCGGLAMFRREVQAHFPYVRRVGRQALEQIDPVFHLVVHPPGVQPHSDAHRRIGREPLACDLVFFGGHAVAEDGRFRLLGLLCHLFGVRDEVQMAVRVMEYRARLLRIALIGPHRPSSMPTMRRITHPASIWPMIGGM
ncbi:MAG: hypothetical protein SOW20_04835 [Berryella intestinalis]|nr:hypothetical protein [Berryella intestinalis]MDD7368704.1 hypothetical protein [Berryella intestinalis]MDY3129334.1 hypothetical protein [Berryella intestinalis]